MQNKIELYEEICAQAQALIQDEDAIAALSNISALLMERMEKLNWVGFYRLHGSVLKLGPFQGKVACTRIPIHSGVCGKAVRDLSTQRIADVHQFDGHIACDSCSQSELVVCLYNKDKCWGVLDIDSPHVSRFDETDQIYMEKLAVILSPLFHEKTEL